MVTADLLLNGLSTVGPTPTVVSADRFSSLHTLATSSFSPWGPKTNLQHPKCSQTTVVRPAPELTSPSSSVIPPVRSGTCSSCPHPVPSPFAIACTATRPSEAAAQMSSGTLRVRRGIPALRLREVAHQPERGRQALQGSLSRDARADPAQHAVRAHAPHNELSTIARRIGGSPPEAA